MDKTIIKNISLFFLFSLICCFLYPQSDINLLKYILIPIIITIITSIFLYKEKKKELIIFAIEYLVLNTILYITFKSTSIIGVYIFIFLIAIQLAITIYLYFKEKISKLIFTTSTLLSLIFIRIFYILTFTIFDNQNDIGVIEEYKGHLGYISYFVENNSMPSIDLLKNPQFYHPPLFHYLSSLWVKFNSIFFDDIVAYENLQYFTLFLNLSTIYFGYLILKKLNIKNIFAYLIISFIPTTVLFSGYINNDSLLLLLTTISIYFFLNWRDTHKFKDMIIISILCALGMMTKFSMAILIFILIVFGLCEITKENWKNLILQFLSFGIIQIGGIWFNIRNYFGTGSFLYMQLPMNENLKLNGILSLFKINLNNLKNPFVIYDNLNPNYDSNYLISGVKTFLFNECNIDNFKIASLILLYLTLIIYIYGIIKFFKNRKNIEEKYKFLWHYIILGITLHIIYIFLSPFFCTLNARYIYIQHMILLIYAIQNKNNNKILKIISLFIIISSILSLLCFI